MPFSRSLAALLALAPLTAMAPEPGPTTPPTPTKDAASADVLPFSATEKTLPNGLKVIVVPTGFPNIVSLQIPVQTGSRNEVEPGKSGFAHFFEHMMFRGTKAYPADKYQAILTKIGARQNAYTTDDYTNYHTTFSKDDLELMLQVEADRFMNLEYSEEAFKTEARAVLGEYNKNSANPLVKIEEVQHDAGFTTHTYKHTTMGFIKDIEDMPNQFVYSKTFFDRWYRPEYTTVIVAGDVDPTKVVPMVGKYWSAWKRGSGGTVTIPAEPPSKTPVYAHVPWSSSTLPWVTVAFHGPAFSETAKDFAAVNLLLDIDFGPTSDIYKRLVQKEQKVDQLFAFRATNIDPELPGVGARVKKMEDATYVRDEILKTMAAARAAAPDATRVEEAKSNLRYGFARTLDNTETIAATLARFVRYRRSYDTLNQLYRTYAALTPADLSSAARTYLTDSRLVVTTLSRDPVPAAMSQTPALASLPVGSMSLPAPAPSHPAAPSDMSSTAASDAVKDVPFIIQQSKLPQLSIKLEFAVGSAEDPPGK